MENSWFLLVLLNYGCCYRHIYFTPTNKRNTVDEKMEKTTLNRFEAEIPIIIETTNYWFVCVEKPHTLTSFTVIILSQ